MSEDGTEARPPALILPIDQAEELFQAEGGEEARSFLDLLRDLVSRDDAPLIVVFTIRSDSYERLQTAESLQGLRPHLLSLPPMRKGAYAEVIKGPARRLEGSKRALKIEEPLVDALLADMEAGGAKDALPLLAFTLERLYVEQGGDGDLRLAEYEELGGVKGSIEAAVERALKAADTDPKIPRDRAARLALLRRGLIPWLAGIDSETGSPRRRVARLSEIPAECRPLIDLLVEQRLLSTDVSKETGEVTIEPVHEALLRQWGLLQGWLEEDLPALATLQSVKRASRDWAANGGDAAWLYAFRRTIEGCGAARRPAGPCRESGAHRQELFDGLPHRRASGRSTQPPRASGRCRSARAARIGWFGVVVSGHAAGTRLLARVDAPAGVDERARAGFEARRHVCRVRE
jgi:hypothetical protein